jgi:hypothetical protein
MGLSVTATTAPYHIVEKSGIVHHTKLGRSCRFRVIFDRDEGSSTANGPTIEPVLVRSLRPYPRNARRERLFGATIQVLRALQCLVGLPSYDLDHLA